MSSEVLKAHLNSLALYALEDLVDYGSYEIHYDLKMNRTSVVWSPEVLKMSGYSRDEFPEMLEAWICKIHPEDRNEFVHKFESAVARREKNIVSHEYRFLTKSQGVKWFRSLFKLELTEDGLSYVGYGVACDISEKKKYEQKFQSDEVQLQYLKSIAGIFNTVHVVNLSDSTFVSLKKSPTSQKFIKGFDNAEQQLNNLLNQIIEPDYLQESLEFLNLHTVSQRMKNQTCLIKEFPTNSIGWTKFVLIADKKDPEGNLINLIIATMNVDKDKKEVQKLKEISIKDNLTGVLNRYALDEELKNLQTKRLADDFAIVIADINGLKTINDTYGHDAGDELLRGFVECLKTSVGDKGTIYRAGGDEFVVIAYATVKNLAERRTYLRQLMSEWKHKDFRLSASLGYARAAEFPNNTVPTMLKVADQRMYSDKKQFYELGGQKQIIR